MVLALLGAALALAACGEKTINIDKAEAGIKDGIESQTSAQVKTVDCPDEVTADKGAVFTCSVIASDGTKHTVRVTQTDDKGGINWKVVE